MGKYREERKLAVKRQKNTMCLQTIQSEELVVYFEHDLSMTGPYTAISIKENLKEELGERMRNEGSDRGTWSVFWLAVLENSIDFLSIFFICDLNSCILIKTSRVQGKKQAILPLTFSSALELKSELE